jgi:hypothetical protein
MNRTARDVMTLAGLMIVLAAPTAALAQEAPANAPAPAAAATAEVDQAALRAIQESADAIKALGPVRFNAKSEMSLPGGANALKIGGEVTVRLIRHRDGVSHSYALEGTYSGIGTTSGPDGNKVRGVMLENRTVQWLQSADERIERPAPATPVSYSAKTLVERPLKSNEPGISRATLASDTFREVFLAAQPFAQELQATKIAMQPAVTIDGDDCMVVKVTLSGGRIERIIAISAIDKLPRRYEQRVLQSGAEPMRRTFEFSKFDQDKTFTVEDLRIPLPEGWKLDKKTEADYPSLATPAAAAKPAVPTTPRVDLPGTPAMRPQVYRSPDDLRAIIEMRREMASMQKELDEKSTTDERRAEIKETMAKMSAKIGTLTDDEEATLQKLEIEDAGRK